MTWDLIFISCIDDMFSGSEERWKGFGIRKGPDFVQFYTVKALD